MKIQLTFGLTFLLPFFLFQVSHNRFPCESLRCEIHLRSISLFSQSRSRVGVTSTCWWPCLYLWGNGPGKL